MKNLVFVSILVLFLPCLLQAHPDVFVDTRLTFIVSNDRPTGIKISWCFDEAYSRQVIVSCDTDSDGILDDEEFWYAQKKSLDRVANPERFMTRLWLDETFVSVLDVVDFTAVLTTNQRVIFSFTYLFDPALAAGVRSVKVHCIDRTRYYAFLTDRDSVSLSGSASKNLSLACDAHGRFQLWCPVRLSNTNALPKKAQASKAGPAPFADLSSSSGSLWEKFVRLNRDIHVQVVRMFRSLADSARFSSLLGFFLLAFGYGFVHAVGPGHGKLLVASWFIDHGCRSDVVKMAALIAAIHTGSAVLLTILFHGIFTTLPTPETQEKLRAVIISASGIALIVLGMFRLFGCRRCQTGQARSFFRLKGESPLAVALAAGVIPCPMTMSLLLLSVVLGIFPVGLLAVTGVSCGMFVLLLLVGFSANGAGKRLQGLIDNRATRGSCWRLIPSLLSAISVILLGFLVLLGGTTGNVFWR